MKADLPAVIPKITPEPPAEKPFGQVDLAGFATRYHKRGMLVPL
ncbi:hypothetical protein GY50_0924 [Dehalococcoides mccartyi GY50]|nr:hypothetical protein GY50_0924 [Dehalococcoides mccartyi GY50]